jgi:transposase
MAFREVGMFEIKEVLRLHFGGVPKKAIARTVGVDVKTVRRYIGVATELGVVLPLDDAKLELLFSTLKAETEREHGEAWKACDVEREFIKKLLDDGVRLTKVRKLLERKNVLVPYPTLHRFAAKELSFGVAATSVRLADPAGGSELQVDSGLVVTLTVDGQKVRKKAFIFTPTLSRYRFVYPVDRETTASAIEACEAAWAFYQGIFEVLLPDNTKAIVVRADDTSPGITEAFLEYSQLRNFTVDPARVRKPKDKARVEKTVAFVRDDCFGGEQIATLDGARVRALFWCEHEAGVAVHGTTQRRPKEHFLAAELPHLRAAPQEPYDVPVWASLTVDRTQHVAIEGSLYMLPIRYVGRKLRARADKSLVRFYDGGVVVKVLPRVGRGERSFDEADIPEHKRAYALRDDGFLADQARQHSDVIGDFADRIRVGPKTWTRMRRVSALLGLVRRYGVPRVEAECRRAIDAEMNDVDRLRRMLERPTPALVEDNKTARVIPIAKYLRPASDYALKIEPHEGD